MDTRNVFFGQFEPGGIVPPFWRRTHISNSGGASSSTHLAVGAPRGGQNRISEAYSHFPKMFPMRVETLTKIRHQLKIVQRIHFLKIFGLAEISTPSDQISKSLIFEFWKNWFLSHGLKFSQFWSESVLGASRPQESILWPIWVPRDSQIILA